jgi:hypothetical protein
VSKGIGKAVEIGSFGLIKGKDLFPGAPQAEIANREYFDIGKEAGTAQKNYAPLLAQSQANQQATAPGQQQVLAQMALAAQGKGPSLAEMQLRGAQDRGFKQQLAAAQSQRASSPALAQRQLLLNMGNANRDLAQQSAISRLQERDAFLQQANQAQQGLRTDVAGQFNYATAPKQSLQNWETARVGGINQQRQQNAANEQALIGSLLGGAAQVAGASMGKKADGGLVSKKDVPGMADGGFISSFKNAFVDAARKGNLGAKTKVAQESEDQNSEEAKKAEALRRRREQERAMQSLACGGQVKATHEYKAGGPVDGPGTSRSDSIPTMLSDGEFVIKAAVVKKPGMLELLEKINAGQMKPKEAKKEAATYGTVLAAKKKNKDA